jgi:hypothetical protein
MIVIILMTGCGSSEPKRYAVSGTVSYKKQPIPNGTITFIIADGGVAGGSAINEGKYEIPASSGLLPGKYKVSISYPDPKFQVQETPGDAPGIGGQDTRPRDFLPKKYNSETTLTVEIKEGNNTFPFDLE